MNKSLRKNHTEHSHKSAYQRRATHATTSQASPSLPDARRCCRPATEISLGEAHVPSKPDGQSSCTLHCMDTLASRTQSTEHLHTRLRSPAGLARSPNKERYRSAAPSCHSAPPVPPGVCRHSVYGAFQGAEARIWTKTASQQSSHAAHVL